MSGFGRGRSAAGRTVERDGPFGAVRSCPLQQRSHPSNLREAKAQGRTAAAGKDERRRRRSQTGATRAQTQKPNRPILDRPTHRAPASLPLAFSGGACTAFRETKRGTVPTSFNRAGRSHGKTTVTGAPANGTWVRACRNAAPARPRDQTCEGSNGTPGAPSGARRRKRYRHTRDIRPASQPATFTGRKLKQASTPKGARPGHVTRPAGSGTPADKDSAGA